MWELIQISFKSLFGDFFMGGMMKLYLIIFLYFFFFYSIQGKNIDLENARLDLLKSKVNKEIYQEETFEKNRSKNLVYAREIIEASTQYIYQNYIFNLEKLRLDYKEKELLKYIESLEEKYKFYNEYTEKVEENKESFSEIELEEIRYFSENLMLDKKRYEIELLLVTNEKKTYYESFEEVEVVKSYLEAIEEQEKLLMEIINQEEEINKYKRISEKNKEVFNIENKILKNKIGEIKKDYLFNIERLNNQIDILKLQIKKNKNMLKIKENELEKKKAEWQLGMASYKDYFEADINFEKERLNLYKLELQLELLQKELEL